VPLNIPCVWDNLYVARLCILTWLNDGVNRIAIEAAQYIKSSLSTTRDARGATGNK